LKEFEKNLYSFMGQEAVRHIFRVASSLDSMVVGEPQILGQIKSAYEMSVESRPRVSSFIAFSIGLFTSPKE